MSELPAPRFELVGPTAEHDVSRLISRYGKDAVLAAVKKLTKAKRGRKAEKDWLLLQPHIEQDAADWLEGREPEKLRSSYSIANAVAADNPGHNQTATATRILKKLSARRRWFFLTVAWQRSESTHPHGVHLRTLKALAKQDETFGKLLNFALNDVARYRERVGEPGAKMTMDEIKKFTENALLQLAPKGTLGRLTGMFGNGILR